MQRVHVGSAFFAFATFATLCSFASGADLPHVKDVEAQPLAAATERLLEALKYVGAPLPEKDEVQLKEALRQTDARKVAEAVQRVLDPLCIAGITVESEDRVVISSGSAPLELVQQGWRTYLVKVSNSAGSTAHLHVDSPNIAPIFIQSTSSSRPKSLITLKDVPARWMDASFFDKQPLSPRLSGLGLEYRVLQIYSRDAGQRDAKLGFHLAKNKPKDETGFLTLQFTAAPAVKLTLGVRDFDGQPATCAFVFRDRQGRVHPNPARRLAPDFFFHEQIYRADGESVLLPSGDFTVTVSRGPEYHVEEHNLRVPSAAEHRFDVKLRRWTHSARRSWYSGDHHVHAAGCKHYENPTEGVTPADMLRHILGEDLNVGCVLTWGPCWYTQKQYFEGKVSALSRPENLMRYDVEVSGFPSSHAGHLCLLRLTEDDYPKTETIEQWPSWTLPVLAWGQKQGAVVGYSHSGWGLALPDYLPDGSRKFTKSMWGGAPSGWTGHAADKLPDYEMPPFDGIGANEYVVTTALGVCDFISAVDTPVVWELNVWYHTLNCGMRSRISGETDFPCIYGQKVGLGRIYVQLDDKSPLSYDRWVQGVKDGRSYCGDGLSHLFDFKVNGLALGTPQKAGAEASKLALDQPGKVRITCDATAFLADAKPTTQTEAIRNARLDEKPYWHLERARVNATREVPVELIVNGQSVAKKMIVADGKNNAVSFDVDVPQSSWIALRIFPSCHTNPVFVEVAGKPIRASRRSAEWCVKAVDTCWKTKEPRIRATEKEAAKAAYDKARAIYAAMIPEAIAD